MILFLFLFYFLKFIETVQQLYLDLIVHIVIYRVLNCAFCNISCFKLCAFCSTVLDLRGVLVDQNICSPAEV